MAQRMVVRIVVYALAKYCLRMLFGKILEFGSLLQFLNDLMKSDICYSPLKVGKVSNAR